MTDEQLTKAIVDYTQRIRPRHRRERFPLTAGWIRRVARRLGHPIGRDRAYQIQHFAIERQIIEPAGSYQKTRFGRPTGWNVNLWRRGGLRQNAVSVPGANQRKRQLPWWQHPLYGFGTKTWPTSLPKALRKWKPAFPKAGECFARTP